MFRGHFTKSRCSHLQQLFSPFAELRLNRRVDIACPVFPAIWVPTARKPAHNSHTRVAGTRIYFGV